MKCLKRILRQNVTENISNHSPGEQKSLAVPPDCEVKKKKEKKTPNKTAPGQRLNPKGPADQWTSVRVIKSDTCGVPLWKG